jgi:molybdopterin molybdotransferase
MAGHRDLFRPTLRALADVDLPRRPDGKTHFLRASATVDAGGRLHVRPSGGQDSHQLKAMADANALVMQPDGNGARAGDEVDVLVFDADRLGPRDGPSAVPRMRG